MHLVTFLICWSSRFATSIIPFSCFNWLNKSRGNSNSKTRYMNVPKDLNFFLFFSWAIWAASTIACLPNLTSEINQQPGWKTRVFGMFWSNVSKSTMDFRPEMWIYSAYTQPRNIQMQTYFVGVTIVLTHIFMSFLRLIINFEHFPLCVCGMWIDFYSQIRFEG